MLSTSATWYAEFGVIHTATDPSGLTTAVELDNLGRSIRVYGPGCPEPKAAIEYHLGTPVSYVHTRTNETCEPSSAGAVSGDAMEAYAWVDGLGRGRAAVSEGSPSDGLAGILTGVQVFDSKGAVQRAYLPCDTTFPPVSGTTALPLCRSTARPLHAASSYDAFGRVVRAWTTDGTQVVATRYGALVTDVWDAGDLAPGIYHATPATTYVDGLGRTVRTVERNGEPARRSPPGGEGGTFATALRYNSLGAVVEMQRGEVSGTERWSDFRPGLSVVKTQRYDTLGRRIENHDPDAGLYRYSFDPLDRLVSTMDARGTVNRYWYDRGGRLAAEDLGGDVPYEAASWATLGGTAASTCDLDEDGLPSPARPRCFDVLYGFDLPFARAGAAWESALEPGQGPLAGRPSWTKDRAGTVVLGYDDHGWAVWSARQFHPDWSRGYPSRSTFDEVQRLLTEVHADGSQFDFQYTSRGLLWRVDFEEDVPDPDGTGTIRASRPLIRRTEYDVQARRVEVEYGDRLCVLDGGAEACDPLDPPPDHTCECPEYDASSGTVETYAYDSRQRLARKQAVRSDDFVVLDYRYSYDVASNIVRLDDERLAASEEPWALDDFVPCDMEFSYDALGRSTRAEPIYREAQPQRVGEQTWSFDALGSMLTWNDDVGHFYGWSLGDIQNGLQRLRACDPAAPLPQDRCDPGLGPLPRQGGVDTGCPLDALDRCVPASHVRASSSPAPNALYAATGPDGDTLRAYYDAAGNMMALVVHRPQGCGREDDSDPTHAAAGGPDGSGCREGADFRLLFAWDEVGNMLAVERQRLEPRWSCDAAGGGIAIQPAEREEYLGPEGESGRATHEWCPVARVESAYDFGGQRRMKHEATLVYEDRDRWPAGWSLYVSASFEVREARRELDGTYQDGLAARYLWNEAGILFELDADVSPQGAPMPKSRLTLTNQLGSASSVLDPETGGLSAILSQLPYGAEEQTLPRLDPGDAGAFAPRYEFTGKERDRGVGLVYFGARSLVPQLARWTSADPFATARPLASAETNPFAFSLSNPVRVRDPNGLDNVAVFSTFSEPGDVRTSTQVAETYAVRLRAAPFPEDRVVSTAHVESADALRDVLPHTDPSTGGILPGLVDPTHGPLTEADVFHHGNWEHLIGFNPTQGAVSTTGGVIDPKSVLRLPIPSSYPGLIAPDPIFRMWGCNVGADPTTGAISESLREFSRVNDEWTVQAASLKTVNAFQPIAIDGLLEMEEATLFHGFIVASYNQKAADLLSANGQDNLARLWSQYKDVVQPFVECKAGDCYFVAPTIREGRWYSQRRLAATNSFDALREAIGNRQYEMEQERAAQQQESCSGGLCL
ncbi:MAG: RHS repeat-associated core domain-containing protein [Deltaproteobacteria bacterium]|nr:RHS repeat-associated core domain-containing protein [Deltaproteobacteria bacterium]